MKKAVMLSIGLLIGCLNVMLYCMDEKQPIFVLAKQGEDLSAYKEILTDAYLRHTNPGEEECTRTSIERRFPLLTSWIGQEGKRFIKILDNEEPVGFLTLEGLDDPTRIAVHASPILPEYAGWYPLCFDRIKQEFPKAKTVSTTCPPKLAKLLEIIKKLGFEQDDSYTCNEELAAGRQDLVGYTKKLD